MDSLSFTVEMVKALIWPCCVFIVAIVLRKPLSNLLVMLNKVKYNDLEIEFKSEIGRLQMHATSELPFPKSAKPLGVPDSIAKIAAVSPKAAVIESWRYVEQCALQAAMKNKISIDEVSLRKPLKIAEKLLDEKMIDEPTYGIFKKLRILRNEAEHYNKAKIEVDDAISYAMLAERLCSLFAEL
jgi:hypothetical protein